LRRRWRILLLVEVCAGVHTKASRATAEAISLRSIFAAVAGLAEEHIFVAVGVSRVQHLVAHTAFVTFLVEGNVAYHPGLGVVYGLAALRALGGFGGFERHGCGGWWAFTRANTEDG